MKNINLSSIQQEIVDFVNGCVVVKASAGSGKTRVLTERIRKLTTISKRKILALTFTNKAGEEIENRLSNIDDLHSKVYVGTFHSFCQNILESHGHLIGLPNQFHIIDKESDRLEILKEVMQEIPSLLSNYNNRPDDKKKTFFRDALYYLSKIKRELLHEEQIVNDISEDIWVLFSEYNNALITQNSIDFDDLLYYTYKLFSEIPKVAKLYRRSYEFICIDEAQDLNDAQYGVLRALTNSEHKNIMLVGDPNQSIFAFNGSSSEFMINNFISDYDSVKVFELLDNYRSSEKVLELANKIIPDLADTSNLAVKGDVQLNGFETPEVEAQWIFSRIKELVKEKDVEYIEGEVSYENISVLARNKYLFSQLEILLLENKVPFYYKTTPGAIEFESDLMNIFMLTFKIKLNKYDELHIRELISLLKIDSFSELLDLIDKLDNDSLLLKRIIQSVIDLKDDGTNLKKILSNLRRFTEECKGIEEDEKELFVEDIEELGRHWMNYQKKTTNYSLLQFKNFMALGKTHPYSEPKGICLSTVHTMKGQEFDIVFVLGLDDGTFPDYRSLNDKNKLQQEKNNFYVAITRSRRLLYLTYPRKRTMPWGDIKPRNISSFLKDIQL